MKRIILIVTVAALMAVVMAASALPALARAINTKEQCVGEAACGQAVLTPSGNLNAGANFDV